MSVELMTLLLFGSLVILLMLGLPLVFALGGVAIVGLYFTMGSMAPLMVYMNTMDKPSDLYYISIPLFIFMAYMMEGSGIVENLYDALQYWSGRIPGSLAIGTVIISTVLAAMVGISSASIITMGVTVLPSMLRRGYDKSLAMGSITASSTLGILIPPSALSLLYAVVCRVSIGRLFLAGFLPGLVLSALFILYIGIRCHFQPSLGPPYVPDKAVTLKNKLSLLWALIPPFILVLLVLGSVFTGKATTTESAAVGSLGATIMVAANRKLTWKIFKEVNYKTLLLTGMIMWALIAASSFRAVYVVSGAIDLIPEILLALPLGAWGTVVLLQFILLILGCFLDEFGILLIVAPVFASVTRTLGFDPVWFGILFVVNMEIGELTPPVGLNLFYMKAVAPEDTTMVDIYRSIAPFVGLLILGLALFMIFPQIVLWLPNAMIK